MLDSLGLVSKQVGVLFALMVVGFLCNRRKLLNAVAIKGITELLVLIVTPCVIVHSFIQQKGVGPRRDKTHSVARQIRQLSLQDIPHSEARIDEKGRIYRK